MLKKVTKCLLVPFLIWCCLMPTRIQQGFAKRIEEQDTRSATRYMLYPKPQTITYLEGSYILQEGLNLIYDEGIDSYTRNRMQEVARIKKLNVQTSQEAVVGKTNIYVGLYNSNGPAATSIQNSETIDATLFDKTDAYYMKSDTGTISILGSDVDASFYGVTTLYQIVAQMDSYRIRNFEIADYADVKSRGFIEGYYGNPWSQEDRIDLMKFGGYHKLNAYFYAPKDDPKHNAKWRELYTTEELKNIAALASAGNESKTRFVFALHPFMNAPMKFDTEVNYQSDLNVLQTKFKQVIDQGVRQIAILDDDAALPGGNAENALKVVRDMTTWLQEIQNTIPDMKLTLPYVPANYMGDGSPSNPEFQALKQAPDNVQVVMTGGKIWGEVSKAFTEKFTANMGKGPFLWINWPCSDNSKKHLIMGGNSTFLHPNVDATKVQGIMLNPMQQSEPSKVAIFANAAYAWNIWESEEEAQQVWEDSFTFVDHNTALPSEASNAYRELSKHMINQAMDNRVSPLQESLDLKLLLDPYKEKISTGTMTIEETERIRIEFEKLKQAAKTYRNNAGNTRTRDQILPWLNCWQDTTEAAISYLSGIKAALQKDVAGTLNYFNTGMEAFERSKTYGYHYVDHMEYAQVGVQHIVPFIHAMKEFLSNVVKTQMDPSIVTQTFITSRMDTPVGDMANVFDGNDATSISFRNPSYVYEQDYVGVMFSKEIDVKEIRFLLGDGKNHIDFAKAQYTRDGSTWHNINDNEYQAVEGEFQEVKIEHVTLRATGIRLVASRANIKDAWLQVNEIEINKKKVQAGETYTGTLTLANMSERGSNTKGNVIDGNIHTEGWFANDPYEGNDRDGIPVDANITLTFDHPKPIAKVYIAQGITSASDVLSNANIEYLAEDDTWHTIASMTKTKEQTFDVAPTVVAKAVRIQNKKKTNVWWRLAEFQVIGPPAKDKDHVYTNIETNATSLIEDSKAILVTDSISLKEHEYIGLVLDTIREITSVDVTTIPNGWIVQTSKNGVIWETYDATKKVHAKYIRIINPTTMTQTMTLPSFVVHLATIKQPKLLKATTAIDPNWGIHEDMRPLQNDGHLFDGILSSGAEIGGFPQKGEYAIFDLGQTRTISSFRYYVVETQYNYIRDGVFELADHPDAVDSEWKAILNIGDGIENTEDADRHTSAKQYPQFTHDRKNPGNMYKEATNVNASGRYLRLRFSASNNHRAVYFNELQINNGEYVSTEPNKDVITSVVEEAGKLPSNMFDKDILTTFKPSAANGNFVYYISNPNEVRTIRFAQTGAVSNANVRATLMDVATKQRKEHITLGNLAQSISDFMIPDGSILLDISVTWKDAIPEISEIITTANSHVPDKTALEVELARELDVQWIQSSKDAYRLAQSVAQEVFLSLYTTQDAVDMATHSLQAIRANAKMKADSTKLQQLVDHRKAQIEEDVEIYTNRSYNVYGSAINNAILALQDIENLSVDINRGLVDAIEKADRELVYASTQIELAQVTIHNDTNKYPDSKYTTNSYKAYQIASDALKQIVDSDTSTRQHPMLVSTIRNTYQKARMDLVDISALTALFTNYDRYNPTLYDDNTFHAYKRAVEEAKVLLVNGTKKEVADAIQHIQEKEAGLILISTQLEAYIEELEKYPSEDYTRFTYAILTQAIEVAKGIDTSDPVFVREHIQILTAAKAQLVDIRQLNVALEEAAQYESSEYTKDSYEAFVVVVKDSTKLQENGTVQELAKAIYHIKEAIQSLQPLAKELEAYRSQITVYAQDLYTQESYQTYRHAYQTLMDLALDNTSVITFQFVRSAFEHAESNLMLLDANYSAVENALAKVPSEINFYTPQSVAHLQEMIRAVVYGKKKDEQAIVDEYARNIEQALQALTYKRANYDTIHALLAKLPKDVSRYTEQSIQVLYDAIKAIDYHKSILEQDLVDRYAMQLQKALQGLQWKAGTNGGSVNTFDTTKTVGYIVLCILTGGIWLLLCKKRKSVRS